MAGIQPKNQCWEHRYWNVEWFKRQIIEELTISPRDSIQVIYKRDCHIDTCKQVGVGNKGNKETMLY